MTNEKLSDVPILVRLYGDERVERLEGGSFRRTMPDGSKRLYDEAEIEGVRQRFLADPEKKKLSAAQVVDEFMREMDLLGEAVS